MNIVNRFEWIISPKERDGSLTDKIISLNLAFHLWVQVIVLAGLFPIYYFIISMSTSDIYLFIFGIFCGCGGLLIYYKKGAWRPLAHLILFTTAAVVFPSGYFNFMNAAPFLIWCLLTFVFGYLYMSKLELTVWALLYLIGMSICGYYGVYSPIEADLPHKELYLSTLINFGLTLIVIFIQLNVHFKLKAILFDQLKESDRSLAEKLEENKKLVRIITHDIANPLTVIEYVTERIASEKADYNDLQLKLKRSASTIKEILSDVRSLQKIIDGVQKLDLFSNSIDEIVLNTIKEFEEKLKQKNIQIEYTKNSFEAELDPQIFKNQVLSNLLSNAIKFTYPNNKILISARQIENRIFLDVRDFGTGIDAEMMPKLFIIKQKVSLAGTAGEIGTGYGLPICKAILELMGGNIDVESKTKEDYPNDHGTVFTVSLNTTKLAG